MEHTLPTPPSATIGQSRRGMPKVGKGRITPAEHKQGLPRLQSPDAFCLSVVFLFELRRVAWTVSYATAARSKSIGPLLPSVKCFQMGY